MTFFAMFLFAAFGVVGPTLIGGRGYRRIPEVRPVVALGWVSAWHGWQTSTCGLPGTSATSAMTGWRLR
jgi:hypothetical protein